MKRFAIVCRQYKDALDKAKALGADRWIGLGYGEAVLGLHFYGVVVCDSPQTQDETDWLNHLLITRRADRNDFAVVHAHQEEDRDATRNPA